MDVDEEARVDVNRARATTGRRYGNAREAGGDSPWRKRMRRKRARRAPRSNRWRRI